MTDRAQQQLRPQERTRRSRLRRLTTPGVLGMLIVGLVLLSIVAGTVIALSVHDREQTLADLDTSSGELHGAAEEFHRALSAADVSAASAFLARDQDRTTDRVGYETDYETNVNEAQSALATLVAGSDDAGEHANLMTTLPGRLSEYTVLVETARAYNRQGEAVASTYQLLAADAMRAHLLPAAKTLQESTNQQVAAEQSDSGSFPIVEVVLGLVVLAALGGAQVYLWRRTNRVFNVGLGVATIAAVVLVGWTTFASLAASSSASDSAEDGTDVVNDITAARIEVLAARSNEAHILVASRDDHGFAEYDEAFEEHRDRVTGEQNLLDTAKNAASAGGARDSIDAATEHMDTWLDEHDGIRSAAANGNQQQGVSSLAEDTEGAVTDVDDSLGSAVDETRLQFSSNVEDANGALTGVVGGVIGLAAVIGLGSAAGVWQRLREYR